MEYTREKIKTLVAEQVYTSPKTITDFITEGSLDAVVFQIATTYSLTDQQQLFLKNEIILTLLSFLPLESLQERITESLEVESVIAKHIYEKIQEDVFDILESFVLASPEDVLLMEKYIAPVGSQERFEQMLANAGTLPIQQIDELNDVSPTEKQQLYEKRAHDLIALFNEGIGAMVVFERFKDDIERSKLPKEILMHASSIPYLNIRTLGYIIDNDLINADERMMIKAQLLKHYERSMADNTSEALAQYKAWFETLVGQMF